jgi:Pyrroloquinoline quinone (Coenzyme PQQ) biosynthesis protein C
MTVLMSADELEAELRSVGAARYHNRHPFHQLLHGGALNRRQVQAWALNRYCYQAAIPIKDATLIARTDDPDLRRLWRQRLIDHDGTAPAKVASSAGSPSPKVSALTATWSPAAPAPFPPPVSRCRPMSISCVTALCSKRSPHP